MLKTEYEQLWIGNGKLVLENQIQEDGSVLVENGKIVALNIPCPPNADVIDAMGGYILPGFIDLHVHGGGGSDFMDATVEDMCAVTRAHAKHGTTALLATTMTCEDETLEKVIDTYLQAENSAVGGAKLLGLHLEGPYFSSANKGAQPVGEERIPKREILERFIMRAKGKIVRWDAAPELSNTDIFAEVMNENGIIASVAHTAATAPQANAAFDSGFSHVTHLFSATSTGQKIDGIVYSGVNEAALIRDDVTVEVICDGKHIPKEHMLLAYKMKGSDKMMLITDAMRAAATNDKTSILGGKDTGVPVVIKDGVAQLPDLSFYAGSIGTMDRALYVAHKEYGIPLVDAVKMMSLTPAEFLKIDNTKGSIEKGKDADIVVMNKDLKVEQVIVEGLLVC